MYTLDLDFDYTDAILKSTDYFPCYYFVHRSRRGFFTRVSVDTDINTVTKTFDIPASGVSYPSHWLV